jgi:hypothetical protein
MTKISNLIKKLEKIKSKHGDLDVVVVSKTNACLSHEYRDYELSWLTIANPRTKPQLRIW